MKFGYRYLFALMVLALLPVLTPSAKAETIEITYTFPDPTVSPVLLDGQAFDRVTIPECPATGIPGEPSLPVKHARVLVPYGHEVVSIDVVCSPPQLVAYGLRVEPVQPPLPLSADQIPPVLIDRQAYASDAKVPHNRKTAQSIQTFHNRRLALVDLQPTEYRPSTGELWYYPEIHLNVTTAPTAASPNPRQSLADQEAVAKRIDNPGALTSYQSFASGGTRGYELLIITPDSLATVFEALAQYHNSQGLATEIHTLTDIGANDPHSVRDYIRQEYLASGIRMVLIGGDDNLIPALDLYVVTWDGPGALIEYAMPGDIYFACLDGTFNYDGDGRNAEPTDGDGGGDIDLLPEVGVTRVPAGSAAEANNWLIKNLTYLNSNAAYLDNVLLAGEQLGFGGYGEYGGYAMEEMVGGSDAHGFTTIGFPADEYQIDKLYDLTSLPNNYWYAYQLIDVINSGVHILDHLGHSNVDYAMRTDTTLLRQNLSNTEYGFIYAEGCLAGMFDSPDCWAEYMTVKLPAGAFACVANARVGLGSKSTRHPVHIINREFWDAIYNADENRPEIGMAMLDARFDLAARINEPGLRWTYYETNLFGDPAVVIKPVQSLAIMFPDGTPKTVVAGEETTFDVTVTGVGTGQPVSQSGLLHCLMSDGDSLVLPLTQVRQDEYQAAIPSLSCGDLAHYCVSFDEVGGGRCYAPDTMAMLTALPITEEITVFQDDFETDLGWEFSGGQWARGIPSGLGGSELNYPVPDPTEGCMGANVLGYNLSGDYENSLPARHATSQAIDCSNQVNTRLRYCRWLGVEQPAYDQAGIAISVDGTSWTTLWQNPSIIGDLVWEEVEFDISAVADNQPTVYLRWTMGPTDGGLRYCGWNIDNVRVVSLYCESYLCADIDGSSIGPDIADLVYLVSYMFQDGPAPPAMEACDVDGNQVGPDIADLVYLVTYMFQSGPLPQCP